MDESPDHGILPEVRANVLYLSFWFPIPFNLGEPFLISFRLVRLDCKNMKKKSKN